MFQLPSRPRVSGRYWAWRDSTTICDFQMGNCWLDIRAVEVVADFHHLLLFWRTVASLLILKFSAWGYFQVGKGTLSPHGSSFRTLQISKCRVRRGQGPLPSLIKSS